MFFNKISKSNKGLYFFSLALMSMFSVIGNVIVLNTYFNDIRIEQDMPKWVDLLD